MGEASKRGLKEGLAELRRAGPQRKIDQVRALAADIERTLATGATFAAVAEALTKRGLPISGATLKTYMARIRAGRAGGG